MSVRAFVAVESQGNRGQRVLLSLLLFFAFLVCASMHKVAQASALGLSTQPSAETREGDEEVVRSATSLGLLTPGASSAASECAKHHAPPPLRELDVVETEQTDEDARVTTQVAVLSVALTRQGTAIGLSPPVVAEACADKFWVSSALPRGPPDTHC